MHMTKKVPGSIHPHISHRVVSTKASHSRGRGGWGNEGGYVGLTRRHDQSNPTSDNQEQSDQHCSASSIFIVHRIHQLRAVKLGRTNRTTNTKCRLKQLIRDKRSRSPSG